MVRQRLGGEAVTPLGQRRQGVLRPLLTAQPAVAADLAGGVGGQRRDERVGVAAPPGQAPPGQAMFNASYRKVRGQAGYRELLNFDNDADVDAADQLQFNRRLNRY